MRRGPRSAAAWASPSRPPRSASSPRVWSTSTRSEGFARFTPARPQRGGGAPRKRPAPPATTRRPPAHLALGLLHEPEGLAALPSGPAASPSTRSARPSSPLCRRAAEVPALIPYDADAKKALELTFREALRLGHNYVGTEHLLLALLELEDGDGPLYAVGLDKDEVEGHVLAVLASFTPPASSAE